MTAGTESQPLRVAIFGSGPAAFYAAEHLFKQKQFVIEVDMFDRLPVPFGLVRYGVAPDHLKIKQVTRVFDGIAANPRFRFFGLIAGTNRPDVLDPAPSSVPAASTGRSSSGGPTSAVARRSSASTAARSPSPPRSTSRSSPAPRPASAGRTSRTS